MKNCLLNLYTKTLMLGDSLKDESGQDLVEYALVVALIAFAAIVGMGKVATNINSAFSNVAVAITTNIP